jgi:hypothetical protein
MGAARLWHHPFAHRWPGGSGRGPAPVAAAPAGRASIGVRPRAGVYLGKLSGPSGVGNGIKRIRRMCRGALDLFGSEYPCFDIDHLRCFHAVPSAVGKSYASSVEFSFSSCWPKFGPLVRAATPTKADILPAGAKRSSWSFLTVAECRTCPANEFPAPSVQPHDRSKFHTAEHMAIEHVDDLEFFVVQIVGTGRAAVLNHDDIEAFVSQAAHGR